jgi:hypothetical protein
MDFPNPKGKQEGMRMKLLKMVARNIVRRGGRVTPGEGRNK